MRLGKILRPDVGGVVFGGDVVTRNRSLGDQLADVKVTECNVLGSRTNCTNGFQSHAELVAVFVAVKRHLNELLPKP